MGFLENFAKIENMSMGILVIIILNSPHHAVIGDRRG